MTNLLPRGFTIRRTRRNWQLFQKPWYIFCFFICGIVAYIFVFGTFALVIHARMERPTYNLFTSYVEERPRAEFITVPRNSVDSNEATNSCNKRPLYTLVTFIKSKASNGKRREMLRRSWNSICYLNGWSFRAVYLIGKSSKGSITQLLLEEQARYGDLLQYDGPDDYVNMPSKVLAGMEWASKNLDSQTFYASADDDFLVDLGRFTSMFGETLRNASIERNQFIKNQTTAINLKPCKENRNCSLYQSNRTDLDPVPIFCLFRRGDREPVNRKKGSKWFVSHKVYKSDIYPRYCHGGMYVMSMTLLNLLLNASYNAPILRLDDVWITGILRQRAGIPDYLVANLEPTAFHYGPKEIKHDLYEIMTRDWQPMLGNLTNSYRNDMCKCEL